MLVVRIWKYIVLLCTQTQIEIQKALQEDPTVYEYDAVYDEMEEKKKAANVKAPEKDRKVPAHVGVNIISSSLKMCWQLAFLPHTLYSWLFATSVM